MSAATLPATPYVTLCLIPYNGAPPCYVSSADEYTAAVERYNAAGTEEWEVEVIDGDASSCDLATLRTACETMQPDEVFTLADWLEGADEHERAAAHYLLRHCSNGYSCAGDVLDDVQEVQLFQGSAEEYAEDFAESCGYVREVPQFLRYHIDWEGVARELETGGDIATFRYDGADWVCCNALDM